MLKTMSLTFCNDQKLNPDLRHGGNDGSSSSSIHLIVDSGSVVVFCRM